MGIRSESEEWERPTIYLLGCPVVAGGKFYIRPNVCGRSGDFKPPSTVMRLHGVLSEPFAFGIYQRISGPAHGPSEVMDLGVRPAKNPFPRPPAGPDPQSASGSVIGNPRVGRSHLVIRRSHCPPSRWHPRLPRYVSISSH